MINESNFNDYNLPNLTNTTSQDFNSYDLITSYSDSWQSISNISTKINCFVFRRHPNLVRDIKNYFYDEMITYSVKLSFRLPFSKTDIAKTEELINRFFIEHEETIRFMFTYFFDDIKPILLNNYYLYSISDLRIINSILNCGLICIIFYAYLSTGSYRIKIFNSI
ncbi:unnamed protein product [Rotaria sordida]|uniref:Uncharacterized protein n=1 Tax=Rotaria sordida TaxID=392033 RepID=A0A813TYY7_9BILA|nr:unnamed protein product [Rotaria sordida]CAF0816003.1 unnamed protein product [Rotaria sordida]